MKETKFIQTNRRLISQALLVGLITSVMITPATAVNSSGIVDKEQKISDTEGTFNGILDNYDQFGKAMADIGDLDGDGISDLVVGAPKDDDGGSNRGAVWILHLNADGTVKSEQKISDTEGNFTGGLNDLDYFGSSVASLGYLDNDNVPDIAVGAITESSTGMVWILLLNADGTVKTQQKIASNQGGFNGVLSNGDYFGVSVASLGYLDNDSVPDIAVGAHATHDGDPDAGAVWILFLNANGTVKGYQKISASEGNFMGDLDSFDNFGISVANLGDLNNDAIPDLAVGAYADDDGGTDYGALWVLFLNDDGTVNAHQKISASDGNFTGTLNTNSQFAVSLTPMGYLDGDTVPDLAVGAPNPNAGVGAVWILFLNANGTVKNHRKITEGQSGFGGILNQDRFGRSVANLGDLGSDGVTLLAAGASNDSDGGPGRGAAWILFLQPNLGGTVTGMSPTTVDCINETTGQSVQISLTAGATSWDCVEAGLTVNPNDDVKMAVEGQAD